jgi:uncharacterized membrane protein
MKVQTIKDISTILSIILIIVLVLISIPITMGEPLTNTRSRAAYDFSVEFSDDSNTIEPDQQELFDFKITNLGTNPDTYDLELTGVPVDWNVKIKYNGNDVTQINLDQGKSATLQVIVQVSSSGNSTLTITVTSDIVGSKSDSISITVGYVIKINCLNSKLYLGAGDAVTFKLNVTNYQDISDRVSLDTDTIFQPGSEPDDDNWVISFSESIPTVPAKGYKSINLKLYAPLNAVPPQKVTFKVVGTSENTGESFNSNQIEAIIKNIYSITSSVTPELPEVDPGEVINYTITVINKGNIEDKVMLKTLNDFNNWDVTLRIDDTIFKLNEDELELIQDESKIIKAEVKVPTTAPTGIHNLEIGVESLGGKHDNIILASKVNQIYSLSLDIVGEGYIVDLAATNYVKIRVKNTGNGQDTLTLQVPSSYFPDGWDIYFSSVETSETVNNTKQVDFSQSFSITSSEKTRFKSSDGLKYDQIGMTMLSGQSAYLILGVITPQHGSWGNYSFKVYGETYNIVNKDTKLLTVSAVLKTSNLEFVSIPKLSAQNLTVGDTLKIDIGIRNNYHVSASNFKVKLYQVSLPGEEDKLIESKNIDNIAPNSTYEVTLSWKIPDNSAEGTYLLKLKLDGAILPSNDLPEKNIAISVSKKEDDTEEDSMLILLIIVIIVIIIVVIVLFIVMKKRKKATGSEPEPASSKPAPEFGQRKKPTRKKVGQPKKRTRK